METGYVIQDGSGNQYVWVEVPRTTTVYPTAGINITTFTNTEYTKIENDLKTYTSAYSNEKFTDTWSSSDATGLTELQYNIQKKKMLKSIYLNGGFYVGRYETGTETTRTSKTAALTTPVIKKDVYPYTYVTNAQAQQLSESFATEGYTSSLMFGIQWDLVLKYMETKGTAQADLNSESTTWGNYNNSTYTTYESAKYSTNSGSTWTTGQLSKTSSKSILLTTGASNKFDKTNIYDIAGNVWEWTLESNIGNTSRPCTYRGGNWATNGASIPASYRAGYPYTNSLNSVGFRVALYTDEAYERYYNASNLDGNGTTGATTTVLKDLSGNYDAQIYENPTFGTGYISLNEGGSTEIQYIDIGPVLDKATVTINIKFSVSEFDTLRSHIIGNWENGGVGIGVNASGKLYMEVLTEGQSSYTGAYSINSIETNTIYDVTGVYDGTYVYLYIDGVLQSKVETAGGAIKNPTGDLNMLIGANPGIDEVYQYQFAKMKFYSASIRSSAK